MFEEIDFSVLLINDFYQKDSQGCYRSNHKSSKLQVIFWVKRRRILEHLNFLRGYFPLVFEIIMYSFALKSWKKNTPTVTILIFGLMLLITPIEKHYLLDLIVPHKEFRDKIASHGCFTYLMNCKTIVLQTKFMKCFVIVLYSFSSSIYKFRSLKHFCPLKLDSL